jgi:indole-3-glycerol phosphate synthase
MNMFLERVAESTRQRVREARARIPGSTLQVSLLDGVSPPSFRAAVARQPAEGIKVIAEVKRRSPSRGPIRPDLEVEELVAAYEEGGACAVSVLTEPEFFGGSTEDITRAAAVTCLPILRKDFILDPYQILETKATGASAVLLIVALLDRPLLQVLLEEAREAGLDALVEVHDEAELEAALRAGADIVGINNRNLKTLEVDLETTRVLAPLVPPGKVLVSESGYSHRDQLEELPRLGVDAVLMGEALVRHEDPRRALRELGGDGRALS